MSRTAGSRSYVVMRTVSAIVQLVTLGVGAAEQLDRMTEEGSRTASPSRTPLAPRKIDDEGTAADPGDPRDSHARCVAAGSPGANRSGDARRSRSRIARVASGVTSRAVKPFRPS